MFKSDQLSALGKHASELPRAVGVKSLAEYDPKDLDTRTLYVHFAEIRKASRKLLAKMSDPNRADLRELETAHDATVDLSDAVDLEIALRGVKQTEANDEQRRADMRPRPGDAEAVAGDDGLHSPYITRGGWSDRKGEEVRVALPNQHLATRGEEYRGPGLGAMLRALVVGPRNDAEKRALAEGTDSTGGFTVPTPLAMEFFDRLRAASVVVRAGARTVRMDSETLSLARLETDPTVAWRAENAEITPSDPTFGRVLLEAKSIAGLTTVSRELLEDSVNVGQMLERAFTQATALAFDQACLYGTGENNQPTGIGVLSGINSVSMGDNGASLTGWDKLIDSVYEMQVDNAADPTAMIMHPRTGAVMAKLKDGEGRSLPPPEMIARIPKLITTSIPINQEHGEATTASSILMGNFAEMILGLRSTLRIEVLKERYADHLQYGFLAHMRGDMQVVHKASFCKLVGIL